MPVIRQQLQTRNRPINVARVDTGGAELWQTISANAEKISNTAFKQLSDKSLNEAIELGQTVDNEKVTTINPATGKPEALDAYDFNPRAQQAFNRVIQQRFETSISNEIKLKAKELSMIENISPDIYGEKMSQYLQSMINNAPDSQYKNIIEETGTFYLASTKMNLSQTRLKEQRERENKLFLNTITDKSREFFETENLDEKSLLLENTLKDLDNSIEAGIIKDVTQIKKIKDLLTQTYYESIIQDKASKLFKTQEDVNEFLSGIRRGTFSDADFHSNEIPNYLRPNIANFANTFKSSMDFSALEYQNNISKKINIEYLNNFNEILDHVSNVLYAKTENEDGNLIPLDNEDKFVAYNQIIKNFTQTKNNFFDKQTRYPNLDKDITKNTRRDIWENILSDLVLSSGDSRESLAAGVGTLNNAMSGDVKLSNYSRRIIQMLHDNQILLGEELGTASEYIKRGTDSEFVSDEQTKKTLRIKQEKLEKEYKFYKQNDILVDTITQNGMNVEEFFKTKNNLKQQAISLGIDAPKFNSLELKIDKEFQIFQLTKMIDELNLNSNMIQGMVTYLTTGAKDDRGLDFASYEFKDELGNIRKENLIAAQLESILSINPSTYNEISSALSSKAAKIQENEKDEKAKIKINEENRLLNGPSATTKQKKYFDPAYNWMDSKNWGILSKTGSEKFDVAMNRVMSGQLINVPETKSLLELWSQYSSVIDPQTSQSVNVLKANGVITETESAFLETLNDLVVSFGDSEAFKIIQRINGESDENKKIKYNNYLLNINNDKYSDGKKYQENSKDYISNVLDLKSDEFGISKNYVKHFEYMVLSNYSPDFIEAKLKNIHEKEFVKDDRIVDVRFLDGKTNQSFSTVFTDELERPWAIQAIEDSLNIYGYTLEQPLTVDIFENLEKTTAIGRTDINLPTQTFLNVARTGVDFMVSKMFNKKKTANGFETVVVVPQGSPLGGTDYYVHTYGGPDNKTLIPLQVTGPDGTIIFPKYNSNDIRDAYSKNRSINYEDSKKMDNHDALSIVRKQQILDEKLKYNPISNPMQLVDGVKLPKEILKQIDFKDSRFFAGRGNDKRGYFYINQVVGSGENLIHKPMILTQSRKKVSNANARKILNQFYKDNPKEFKKLLKFRLIHNDSVSKMIAKEFPVELQ